MSSATFADVLEGRAAWSVEQADSLVAVGSLPDGSIDLVLTDPPYSSGGMFRGDRATASTLSKYVPSYARGAESAKDFAGDTRDQRGYLAWTSLWLASLYRAAKPGAVACVFSDWRQLPTTTDALQAGGWIWRGIVPWDKVTNRPDLGRFLAQCEYVAWGSKGEIPRDRGIGRLPGLVRAFSDPREKLHQAGKPVDILRDLCRIVPPGSVVVDPFAGSGSTGVAALAEDMRFVGFETLSANVELARKRIEHGLATGRTKRKRK